MKKKTIVKISVIIGIILLIVIMCGVYLYYQNNVLKVSTYNVVNARIPDDFNNYKIIQISDFHNTKSKTLKNQIVDAIKEEKPNIIVITGDLIDSNKPDIDIVIDLIQNINELAPIYYVTGNHESSINYSEFKQKLQDNKVTILDNKCVLLHNNTSSINLIGIDDPNFANEYDVPDFSIVHDELHSIEFDEDKYSILLSHRPELLNTYSEMNIDLVLSGHAHGGQIRLPFIGGLIAPNQGFLPEYTEGIYTMNNTQMIVSRGIGNSILPYRINNRPDLVVITLNHSDK